jgi:hypothetical protein
VVCATAVCRCKALQGPHGKPLGLYAECRGRGPGGPWVVLDATLDTAGFGDPAAWTHPPTSGQVDAGWLHGRGSADSKAGVALFAHLLADLAQADRRGMAGTLGVLFDLDEHSGGFGGARAFFGQRWATNHPRGRTSSSSATRATTPSSPAAAASCARGCRWPAWLPIPAPPVSAA